MPAPFDSVAIVSQFLANVGPRLSDLPDPFDYTSFENGIIRATLPARLRGKLANLRETENEIIQRFLKEQASLFQTFISRGTCQTTVYDCHSRELGIKEEKERSTAREHWFCGLSVDEKSAFDRYCLAVAGPDFLPLLPASISTCLRVWASKPQEFQEAMKQSGRNGKSRCVLGAPLQGRR
jgi:hypothetical protein